MKKLFINTVLCSVAIAVFGTIPALWQYGTAIFTLQPTRGWEHVSLAVFFGGFVTAYLFSQQASPEVAPIVAEAELEE